MSRRSATTITVQIRLPVPPGHKPKTLVDEFREAIRKNPAFAGFENQVIVNVVKRETTYL